jgi:hypothetical protein
LNPGTQNPPDPPKNGGSSPGSEVFIEERYTTPGGRSKRRLVAVDLDAIRAQLAEQTAIDREDWARFREAVAAIVGESVFGVWFAPLTLGGVDRSGALVAVGSPATRRWLVDRFASVIANASEQTGRPVVIADEAQTQALQAADPVAALGPGASGPSRRLPRSKARRARGPSSKHNKEGN